MPKLMIYGASGYTGGMVAEHAASAGLGLILAGRPRNRAALETLAERLGAEVRVFSLDAPDVIERGIHGVSVLLNGAGPFMHTAKPLMSAAIRVGAHYLDFSAELGTYQSALRLDRQARAAGVMLLPGSGGSVAMLGCLATHAMARVREPRKIDIALRVTGAMSKGSVASAGAAMTTETLCLLGGELVAVGPSEVRDFDFGDGPQSAFPVTLPDLLTIRHAIGVSDIRTYVHVAAGSFPSGSVEDFPAGPDLDEREVSRYRATVEVTSVDGSVVQSTLDAVNGYTFTSMAAAEAARRVLAGEARPGFQTPVRLFGHTFAETIADTRITDI